MSLRDPATVYVLNALVTATKDSARAYREAAEHSRSEDWKALFERRAEARGHVVERLQDEAARFGGLSEPPPASALTRAAGVSASANEGQIIAQLAEHEGAVIEKYARALRQDLPVGILAFLSDINSAIGADQDVISRLRRQQP